MHGRGDLPGPTIHVAMKGSAMTTATMTTATMTGHRSTPANDPISAQAARVLLREGRAPAALRVRERLDLSNMTDLRELPAGLSAPSIDLTNCTGLTRLPGDMVAHRLVLDGCTGLTALPRGLTVYDLQMRGSAVRSLPADLRIGYRLDLTGSPYLRELPPDFKLGVLILADCTALEQLPEGLSCHFLDISGCVRLTRWPASGALDAGALTMRGCVGLTSLPPWAATLSSLDLADCASITALPEGLRVTGWVDVANAGLTGVPASLAATRIRWHGVAVDARVAFHPDTLTVAEVLAERNAERRRVMIERMGYEAFFEQTGVEELDRDHDAGGPRRLLRILLADDEPLVCLAVSCPSTGRRYVLRVPPRTVGCRQAAAWIAGFDDPNDYNPIAES